MAEDEKAFEGWAIVELMGHVRLGAHVSQVELAGAGFLRLEVPEAEEHGIVWPATTQFVAPGAIYRITPCTEDAARLIRSHAEPVTRWEIPARPALETGTPVPFGLDLDGSDVDDRGIDEPDDLAERF